MLLRFSRHCGITVLASLALVSYAQAQAPTPPPMSGNRAAQFAITQRLNDLRTLDDKTRAKETRELAKKIRQLPPGKIRLSLASGLANLSTEGDFGKDTLREVATTLSEAIRTEIVAGNEAQLAAPVMTLAQLAHYERVPVTLDVPSYRTALAALDKADQEHEAADFTLTDLDGKSWTLKQLKGKIVLVNFWATWCPPCRKELPDLEKLYNRYKEKGFVVLGITDETADKVKSFVQEQKMSYPILLDTGRKTNTVFGVQGIPRTFIYDRNGKLAAQAIDMRTEKQFRDLLARAGLK